MAEARLGIERGTLIVSALALIVSLAALWVTADSARGDRQARFDEQRDHCLSVIAETAEEAGAVFYESHRVVVSNRALSRQLQLGVGDFRRACVKTGVIAGDSAFEPTVVIVGATYDTVLVPFFVAFPGETEEQRDERMTKILAENIYRWTDLLSQAEDYVRGLPGVPFLPWQPREVPLAEYDPESGVLEEPDPPDTGG